MDGLGYVYPNISMLDKSYYRVEILVVWHDQNYLSYYFKKNKNKPKYKKV